MAGKGDKRRPYDPKKFADGYDAIFKKQNAYEWCRELYGDETVIYDPDGWRLNDGITMETKINKADFERRFIMSTVLGFIKK